MDPDKLDKDQPDNQTEHSSTPPFNPDTTLPGPASPKKNHTSLLMVIVVVLVIVAAITFFVARDNENKPAKTTNPITKVVAIAPAQVSITAKGFSPATVTVKVNQGIIWTNKDTAKHEVNSDPYPTNNELSSFNETTPLNTSDTYTYVFTTAGTYTYHDNLNPYTYKGTVIVKN